ncbi:MAG: hypothetical protein WCT04_02420 [Planctomycetota bacterium]
MSEYSAPGPAHGFKSFPPSAPVPVIDDPLGKVKKLIDEVQNDNAVTADFKASFLRQPLYGIPDSLTDAIVKLTERLKSDSKSKSKQPLKTELTYERKLAALCEYTLGVGFQSGRQILHSHAVREWGRPMLRPSPIDSAFTIKELKKRRNTVLDLLTSYLGWLITEPAFQNELKALKANRLSYLPLPTLDFLQKNRGKTLVDLDPLAGFCKRWCLSHLETWDLPAPVDMHYSYMSEPEKTFGCMGKIIFVPQTIRFKKEDNIADWINDAFDASPAYLKGWTDVFPPKRKANKRQVGPKDFYNVFTLAHLTRILEGRYPEFGKGCMDHALGMYLQDFAGKVTDRLHFPGKWTVHKLRTTLGTNNRLKPF